MERRGLVGALSRCLLRDASLILLQNLTAAMSPYRFTIWQLALGPDVTKGPCTL